MEIKQMFVSESKYDMLCPEYMNPTEITFHETDNDAPAINERNNVANNSKGTSFHIAIDDKEAIQLIPFNRNAWHAGDGYNGRGNRHSIGIEICYNASGGPRYEKAVQNAIIVIRQLMKRFNIPVSKVKTHYERNGKNCPSRMRREGRVEWFKQQLVNGSVIEPLAPKPPSNGYDSSWFTKEKGVFIANTSIKVRSEPSVVNGSHIRTLQNGGQYNYDGYCIEAAGYVWLRGVDGTYLASGEAKNGKRTSYWGSFK
ncbi:peptidoglycan recognition protein family protein [Bacillus toyonensis]|uniref:peptidoglycan recognition protein family protein n=1 Tax=Bacillus toyonensis TaxID=155322 RepID=UPI00027BEA4F|nr:N-acetylmuramoyl-L-alanine amidase [Bacillus toyonensis]EJV41747.1 N-acetylmuramoyl-L-alanine amidase CwlA [Bacillus toyonensis]